MYPVKRAVQNLIAAPYSGSYIENIRCPCRNERTEDFLTIRFEQFNIFFRTIVVALYGQPDFFIEITLTNLEFAEKKIDNIEFLVSGAETTPFSDNSFDCITAAQCFWYFDRENAINEIKRIIKPNGTFVKIYMSYMLTDELANESHKLVKKLNKNWTPGASGSKDIYNHPFENGEVETFECNIPFTRESWHGRMLACRGTMASMDEATLNKWNKKHLKLLEKYPEEFEIRHKVYIAYYRIKK